MTHHLPGASGRDRPPQVVLLIQQILQNEVAAGALLVVGAVIAILWANSPWDEQYFDLWHTHLAVDAHIFEIDLPLEAWVNDALMAVFFFVVAMEIKREMVHGELANPKRAALPIAGAIGGMAAPALIYMIFNAGTDSTHGWGVPVATDIAFAVGVLSLVGNRIPFGLRVFLLTLAVADDLGGILIIAVFYTESISFGAMLVAAGLVALVFIMQRAGIRNVFAYLAVGGFLWVAVFESGVHATIAGVILGFMTPASSYRPKGNFRRDADILLAAYAEAEETHNDSDEEAVLSAMERLARETEAPLERLERALAPWASFVVLPIFALANAGLPLSADTISDAVSGSVTQGIFFGLLIGKPLGIMLVSYIAVRTGLCSLPRGVTWPMMAGAGIMAGIGFTVALFITGLAFDDATHIDHARMGIFGASVAAAVLGYVYLKLVLRSVPEPTGEPGQLAPSSGD